MSDAREVLELTYPAQSKVGANYLDSVRISANSPAELERLNKGGFHTYETGLPYNPHSMAANDRSIAWSQVLRDIPTFPHEASILICSPNAKELKDLHDLFFRNSINLHILFPHGDEFGCGSSVDRDLARKYKAIDVLQRDYGLDFSDCIDLQENRQKRVSYVTWHQHTMQSLPQMPALNLVISMFTQDNWTAEDLVRVAPHALFRGAEFVIPHFDPHVVEWIRRRPIEPVLIDRTKEFGFRALFRFPRWSAGSTWKDVKVVFTIGNSQDGGQDYTTTMVHLVDRLRFKGEPAHDRSAVRVFEFEVAALRKKFEGFFLTAYRFPKIHVYPYEIGYAYFSDEIVKKFLTMAEYNPTLSFSENRNTLSEVVRGRAAIMNLTGEAGVSPDDLPVLIHALTAQGADRDAVMRAMERNSSPGCLRRIRIRFLQPYLIKPVRRLGSLLMPCCILTPEEQIAREARQSSDPLYGYGRMEKHILPVALDPLEHDDWVHYSDTKGECFLFVLQTLGLIPMTENGIARHLRPGGKLNGSEHAEITSAVGRMVIERLGRHIVIADEPCPPGTLACVRFDEATDEDECAHVSVYLHRGESGFLKYYARKTRRTLCHLVEHEDPNIGAHVSAILHLIKFHRLYAPPTEIEHESSTELARACRERLLVLGCGRVKARCLARQLRKSGKEQTFLDLAEREDQVWLGEEVAQAGWRISNLRAYPELRIATGQKRVRFSLEEASTSLLGIESQEPGSGDCDQSFSHEEELLLQSLDFMTEFHPQSTEVVVFGKEAVRVTGFLAQLYPDHTFHTQHEVEGRPNVRVLSVMVAAGREQFVRPCLLIHAYAGSEYTATQLQQRYVSQCLTRASMLVAFAGDDNRRYTVDVSELKGPLSAGSHVWCISGKTNMQLRARGLLHLLHLFRTRMCTRIYGGVMHMEYGTCPCYYTVMKRKIIRAAVHIAESEQTFTIREQQALALFDAASVVPPVTRKTPAGSEALGPRKAPRKAGPPLRINARAPATTQAPVEAEGNPAVGQGYTFVFARDLDKPKDPEMQSIVEEAGPSVPAMAEGVAHEVTAEQSFAVRHSSAETPLGAVEGNFAGAHTQGDEPVLNGAPPTVLERVTSPEPLRQECPTVPQAQAQADEQALKEAPPTTSRGFELREPPREERPTALPPSREGPPAEAGKVEPFRPSRERSALPSLETAKRRYNHLCNTNKSVHDIAREVAAALGEGNEKLFAKWLVQARVRPALDATSEVFRKWLELLHELCAVLVEDFTASLQETVQFTDEDPSLLAFNLHLLVQSDFERGTEVVQEYMSNCTDPVKARTLCRFLQTTILTAEDLPMIKVPDVALEPACANLKEVCRDFLQSKKRAFEPPKIDFDTFKSACKLSEGSYKYEMSEEMLYCYTKQPLAEMLLLAAKLSDPACVVKMGRSEISLREHAASAAEALDSFFKDCFAAINGKEREFQGLYKQNQRNEWVPNFHHKLVCSILGVDELPRVQESLDDQARRFRTACYPRAVELIREVRGYAGINSLTFFLLQGVCGAGKSVVMTFSIFEPRTRDLILRSLQGRGGQCVVTPTRRNVENLRNSYKECKQLEMRIVTAQTFLAQKDLRAVLADEGLRINFMDYFVQAILDARYSKEVIITGEIRQCGVYKGKMHPVVPRLRTVIMNTSRTSCRHTAEVLGVLRGSPCHGTAECGVTIILSRGGLMEHLMTKPILSNRVQDGKWCAPTVQGSRFSHFTIIFRPARGQEFVYVNEDGRRGKMNRDEYVLWGRLRAGPESLLQVVAFDEAYQRYERLLRRVFGAPKEHHAGLLFTCAQDEEEPIPLPQPTAEQVAQRRAGFVDPRARVAPSEAPLRGRSRIVGEATFETSAGRVKSTFTKPKAEGGFAVGNVNSPLKCSDSTREALLTPVGMRTWQVMGRHATNLLRLEAGPRLRTTFSPTTLSELILGCDGESLNGGVVFHMEGGLILKRFGVDLELSKRRMEGKGFRPFIPQLLESAVLKKPVGVKCLNTASHVYTQSASDALYEATSVDKRLDALNYTRNQAEGKLHPSISFNECQQRKIGEHAAQAIMRLYGNEKAELSLYELGLTAVAILDAKTACKKVAGESLATYHARSEGSQLKKEVLFAVIPSHCGKTTLANTEGFIDAETEFAWDQEDAKRMKEIRRGETGNLGEYKALYLKNVYAVLDSLGPGKHVVMVHDSVNVPGPYKHQDLFVGVVRDYTLRPGADSRIVAANHARAINTMRRSHILSGVFETHEELRHALESFRNTARGWKLPVTAYVAEETLEKYLEEKLGEYAIAQPKDMSELNVEWMNIKTTKLLMKTQLKLSDLRKGKGGQPVVSANIHVTYLQLASRVICKVPALLVEILVGSLNGRNDGQNVFFSANPGGTVPACVAGFTEAWAERKLGKILDLDVESMDTTHGVIDFAALGELARIGVGASFAKQLYREYEQAASKVQVRGVNSGLKCTLDILGSGHWLTLLVNTCSILFKLQVCILGDYSTVASPTSQEIAAGVHYVDRGFKVGPMMAQGDDASIAMSGKLSTTAFGDAVAKLKLDYRSSNELRCFCHCVFAVDGPHAGSRVYDYTRTATKILARTYHQGDFTKEKLREHITAAALQITGIGSSNYQHAAQMLAEHKGINREHVAQIFEQVDAYSRLGAEKLMRLYKDAKIAVPEQLEHGPRLRSYE